MQTDLQSKSREDHMKTTTALKTALFAAAAFGALAAAPAQAASHSVGACLITKTDTNPFFVKMKEGAEAKAAELGVSLKSYAGKIDGDHETQVAAIETCIADGAKGILLTASDTSSIVSAVQQARDAGLLVIALDTPLDPDRCGRRDLCDRQLPGRRTDRQMGCSHPWRRGSQRQDRHA
jgi:fructose transport system substrate-binding protein